MKMTFKESVRDSTKLPNKIREMNKDPLYGVSAISKFVYLILVYVKKNVSTSRATTFSYVMKRFGVNQVQYKKSLIELEKRGIITVSLEDVGHKGILNIVVNKGIMDCDCKFSLIPSAILTTDVYTINQKVFIALMYKCLIKEIGNDTYLRYYSKREMCRELDQIGFSHATVEKMIDELSDYAGYIPIFEKSTGGYRLMVSSIVAICERECLKWEIVAGNKRGCGFPIYSKPDAYQFFINEISREISEVEGFVKKEKAVSHNSKIGELIRSNQMTLEEDQAWRKEDNLQHK